MSDQQSFFDFAAEVGLTKHIGGLEATELLMKLCHVGPGSYVLDVGCGAGLTPCYLARRYGCKVMGVDLLERMVETAAERVKREGLTDMVSIRQADAQDLPFGDNTFDAVITESVTVFPKDKQRAIKEYARVTKPGGYIGLNESTWLKTPVPPEILAWASQDLGANIQPLIATDWVVLLQKAGLKDITQKMYDINLKEESRGILRRYGCGGMLGVLFKMLSLYIKNPAYRKFVKESKKGGITPEHLDEYFGYGLYVGRK